MRVIFMCGPAGSGKSTIAKQLEADGMTRLSFDQEAWRRGYRSMPLPPEVQQDVTQTLRDRLVTLLASGQDVVLDFSFHSRAMRDQWRGLATSHGVQPETIYLNTDQATCLNRVRERELRDGDDFRLDPAVAASYYDNFEPPTPAEGPLTILA